MKRNKANKDIYYDSKLKNPFVLHGLYKRLKPEQMEAN